jgi:hypothetical protein
VLIANLAKALGDGSASLLGAHWVTTFALVAYRRGDIAEYAPEDRTTT